MRNCFFLVGVTAVLSAGSASANVLNTAEALWKLDAADSGSVRVSQITDSLNGHHATSVNSGDLLNWTSVPATGPGGAPAVGPDARGLEFNPVVEVEGSPATVRNPGYAVDNFTVTGSATLITRFKWDGYVSDQNTAWMYNNGLGGLDFGWLLGMRGSGELTVYQNTHTFQSSLTVNEGVWYDVAVVLENDPSDQTNDNITLYLIEEGGSLQIASRFIPVSGQAGSHTRVGGEALGLGDGNQRKAFDGMMDYLAVWDTALSEAQVRSVLIPEPATFSAGLLAIGMLAGRRRKA